MVIYNSTDVQTVRNFAQTAVTTNNITKEAFQSMITTLNGCLTPSAQSKPKLLKITEVMERLQLSRQSVYNLIDKGILDRVKIGKSTRIKEASVINIINEGVK